MAKKQKTAEVKKAIEKPSERVLPDIPKKVGTIKLEKVRNDYQIVDAAGIVLGSLQVPKQLKTFYNPNWGVWRGDNLLDCFSSLDQALTLIQKTFGKSKKSVKKS